MSTEVQKIIEAVRTLTNEQRVELAAALAREGVGGPDPERAKLVRAIQGKYAHLRTSSEAFAAKKREEVDLKERVRTRRARSAACPQ